MPARVDVQWIRVHLCSSLDTLAAFICKVQGSSASEWPVTVSRLFITVDSSCGDYSTLPCLPVPHGPCYLDIGRKYVCMLVLLILPGATSSSRIPNTYQKDSDLDT